MPIAAGTLLSPADDNTYWFFFLIYYLDGITKYNNYII